jgi:hypothetical protein
MDFHSRKLVFVEGPEGMTAALAQWYQAAFALIALSGIKLPQQRSRTARGVIRSAVVLRTAFALLALATLAKNDVSGRCRLADVCAEMLRALADGLSESHSHTVSISD